MRARDASGSIHFSRLLLMLLLLENDLLFEFAEMKCAEY
jgi:hypothetical protein